MINPFSIMKIEVYQCPDCKEEIYSRAQHDFIYCKCKELALDGGANDNGLWRPLRIIGKVEAQSRIIEITVTEKQLYHDWNYSEDKYGRI